MKPKDFIKEDHQIIHAVAEMHSDHEVQMAREQLYHTASNAIELHRMMRNLSEREGLEGWVQEKITLANDYLRNVREWLEHDMLSKGTMPVDETASSGSSGAGSVAVVNKPLRKVKEAEPIPVPKSEIPAYQRKKFGGQDWRTTTQDLENEPLQKNLISHPKVLRRNIGQR